MWETICDAKASWIGWKFGSKIRVYHILGFGPQFTPSPWKMKFRHFEYFQFWLGQNTPPPLPHLLKFRHFLALWVFSVLTCPEYPPPQIHWNQGDRMWRLISVSPVDTISLLNCWCLNVVQTSTTTHLNTNSLWIRCAGDSFQRLLHQIIFVLTVVKLKFENNANCMIRLRLRAIIIIDDQGWGTGWGNTGAMMVNQKGWFWILKSRRRGEIICLIFESCYYF